MNTTTRQLRTASDRYPALRRFAPSLSWSLARPFALAGVVVATLVALAAATMLVLAVVDSLSVVSVGALGIPLVVAGAILLVAVPTVVWEFGVAVVEDSPRAGE